MLVAGSRVATLPSHGDLNAHESTVEDWCANQVFLTPILSAGGMVLGKDSTLLWGLHGSTMDVP